MGVLWKTHALEAAPTPPPLRLALDPSQPEHVPLLHHLARVLDPAVGKLRNVDQAFKLVVLCPDQAGEGPELGELGDLALHQLTLAESLGDPRPRVRLQLAPGKGDAVP